MTTALKFRVQFLFGAVRTAWDSNNAHDRPIKNVRIRTRPMYAMPESVDFDLDLPPDNIHVCD